MQRLRELSHNLLRVMAGVMFFSHGAQKLFGWFGGVGPQGGTVELASAFGVAGIIETIGGTLVALGLFTQPAAFIMSGEMAVAYFWRHMSQSGELFWWANRGELAALYCFIWFYFAWAGAGAFSLDAWWKRRRADATADPALSASPS